jgi:hypothetical protein
METVFAYLAETDAPPRDADALPVDEVTVE